MTIQDRSGDTIVINGFKVRCVKEKDMLKLIEFVLPLEDVGTEYELRKILLPFVERSHLAGTILVDGNSVWNVKELLKDLAYLMKDYKAERFSSYLYKFFTNACGSIAHRDRLGWFEEYPTFADLQNFFRCNEFGKRVKGYAPSWHYDAQLAQELMDKKVLEY